MDSLGHYKLGERTGADRLADVYRATDTALGRTVTLRVLHPDIAADASRRDRLVAAGRAATGLSHPNIAALFQVGDENDTWFFAFEHTPGETLRAAVAGNPLNPRRALDLAVQLADGLADAHSQGFVHGALNADAVVITQKGRIKVLGFGLPLLPPDVPIQSEASLTADDVECMAPERVLGAKGDARADLFSLGCLLYEMLTGRQPFAAPTPADTLVSILSRTPPPVSHANARVPEALDRLVEKCLAKSLDTRADNAATLAAELREVAEQLEASGKHDVPAPMLLAAQQPRRRTWLVILLVILCLAAIAAIAGLQFLR